jgi:hypothetical protein
MMHWRLPELLEEARRRSGEHLNLPHISEATGLSVSTVYMLTERTPKRVDVNTMHQLLVYLSHYLGPLTTHDLLEFELPKES